MSLFKNRTVVGVICILLSLLICFGVTPLFNQSVSQKTEIVRVVKETKAGEEVTREMVQTVEVGGFVCPTMSCARANPSWANMPQPTFPSGTIS